jgi:hypothetical protein
MGTISVSPASLAILTTQGAPLSSLPAQVSSAVLQNATPEDVVSLSEAAIQGQNVAALFGASPDDSTGLYTPAPQQSSGFQSLLANASPEQQAAYDNSLNQLQTAQALLGDSGSTTKTTPSMVYPGSKSPTTHSTNVIG